MQAIHIKSLTGLKISVIPVLKPDWQTCLPALRFNSRRNSNKRAAKARMGLNVNRIGVNP